MFIATSLVVSNPDAYGFDAHEPGPGYVFDRIPVGGGTRLSDVGRILDVDVEVLRALNPSLRQNRVPDVRVPHMLRIPVGHYADNADRLDRLAPPEACGQRFAAATVTFGPRAVRPIAPQEHSLAIAALTTRRETARSLQPRRRVNRDAPVEHYAASAPADVADAESRYAVGRQAEAAREARGESAEPRFIARTEPTPSRWRRPPVRRTSTSRPGDRCAGARGPGARAPRGPARGPDHGAAGPHGQRDVGADERAPRPARRVLDLRRPQYGLTLAELRALNPGVGDDVQVGQRSDRVLERRRLLRLGRWHPRRPSTHTVRRGEHLTGIAERYGLSISDLREWNGLSSDVIRVGQRLRLRARGSRG